MSRRALSAATKRIRPAVFAELQVHIDRVVGRGEELLPLHIGDTHLLPPESARRVLANLDADDVTLHRYGQTSGMGALREAMARSIARRGLSFDPADEILVGNGGTHALYCA